jgi:AraC-like DNA-binding protein
MEVLDAWIILPSRQSAADKKQKMGRRNIRNQPVVWSLSEFLNLVELRSQTWCFVDLATYGGFQIPYNEGILFYALLEGTAKIRGTISGVIDLAPGDVVMVVSGEAHTLRCSGGSATKVFEFLHKGEYIDVPPNLTIGRGQLAARLLCGRLKVRWPGGQHPQAMPPVLRFTSTDELINLEALERRAKGAGAAAVLTRAAMLFFIAAFRDHPQCELLFSESRFHDPIARARHFIEKHPFIDWTVNLLARKVGMGRSNFAARFAAEVGQTPIDFVTEERMKHAANFLEKSNLKIAEISERIGYRSEAAFSRRFTACYGMSPGRMRKKWRLTRREPIVSPGEVATLQ